MNVNDSEVVMSVLNASGYHRTEELTSADVILVNTCAIRENAEAKIWNRLGHFRNLKRNKNNFDSGTPPGKSEVFPLSLSIACQKSPLPGAPTPT